MLHFLWLATASAEPVDPFLEESTADLFRLERDVVTVASRYTQTLQEAPSIVSVITEADIHAMGFRNLTDVLRTIPGVYISVSKESRNLAWFRGVISSDNNKILLLIDGVPWYDGVYTHAWIDDVIPLFHVKQIEIVKGPGSAVYGTNAFSGVINVVTKPAEEIAGTQIRISTGSFARQEVSLLAGDTFENGSSIKAYARMFDLRGDGLTVTPKGEANIRGINPKQSINGGLEFKFKGTTLRYDFLDYTHTYFVNPQNDIDSVLLEGVDNFNLNYRNDFFYVRSDLSMGVIGSVSPYLFTQRYVNTSNYAYYTGLSQDSDGNISEGESLVHAIKFTERYGAGLEAQIQPTPKHMSVLGVGGDFTYVADVQDYVYADGSGEGVATTFGAPSNSWLTDVFTFAQHTWTATWWMELMGGARLDAYNLSGLSVSPRAGLLFVPTNGASIKLLYGRAFRAPNVRELLVSVAPDEFGEVPFTNGNATLTPEYIDTVELDLMGQSGQDFKARASTFVSILENQIIKNVLPEGVTSGLGNQFYANLGSTSVFGFETEVEWRPENFAVDLSYSGTFANDLSTGNQQYAFPQHMGHFRLGWQPDRGIWVNLRGDAYGKRPRTDWTTASKLPDGNPFALIHLNTVYSLQEKAGWSVEGTIFNLLDSDYDTMVFLDDVNALNDDGSPKYPNNIEGSERAMYVSIQKSFQ